MVLVASAVGWLTAYLDQEVEAIQGASLLLTVSLSGLRTLATVVAGATITVAAIVFSITALSGEIASSHYSPRAVAGFFEDRFQQAITGLVIGTFANAVVVLAGFAGVTGAEEFSSLSATGVVVLGIMSAVGFVGYIDHSLRRMRVGAVVRRITDATVLALRREPRAGRSDDGADRVQPEGEAHRIRAVRSGWVRRVDARRIARKLPRGATCRVEVRVGGVIFPGDTLGVVWRIPSRQHGRIDRRLRRAVRLGRNRAIPWDPAFGIQQLVDIALRALSPSVNDPATAEDVVYHLKVPLREVLASDPPARVFVGRRQQRVFLTEAPSRSDRVHGALGGIRLAASSQPTVLGALLVVIGDLVSELTDEGFEGRTAALMEEAELVAAAARAAGLSEPDLKRTLAKARRLGLDESSAD